MRLTLDETTTSARPTGRLAAGQSAVASSEELKVAQRAALGRVRVGCPLGAGHPVTKTWRRPFGRLPIPPGGASAGVNPIRRQF